MFVATCQCLYPVTSLTLLWHQCMFNRQHVVLSSGQHVAVRLPPTSVWSQWHLCMFQQAAHGAMFGPACRCQVTSHLCVTLSMATCCWMVATSTTCLVSGALCPARWLSDQDWGGRGWQTGCGPCFNLSGGCLFKISSKISFDCSCLCNIYKKKLIMYCYPVFVLLFSSLRWNILFPQGVLFYLAQTAVVVRGQWSIARDVT